MYSAGKKDRDPPGGQRAKGGLTETTTRGVQGRTNGTRILAQNVPVLQAAYVEHVQLSSIQRLRPGGENVAYPIKASGTPSHVGSSPY